MDGHHLTEPTRAEWETWYTPLTAVQLLKQSDGPLSRTAILEFMKVGRIRGVTEHMVVTQGKKERIAAFQTLPKEWFEDRSGGDLFWSHGILEYKLPSLTMQDAPTIHRCSGVRLEPAGVHLLLPQAVPNSMAAKPLLHSDIFRDPEVAELMERVATLEAELASKPTSALIDLDALPNKGGRPRAEFWDDLVIEMVRRIYEGDLKPKSQADLVRAMQDWVSEHGYAGGLTQIKPVAAKIFKTFK